MNKVYILILNWNGWQDTVECVESCQKLTYPNFRILIVDNGSTDGSEDELRERFPDIEILQTGENLGFAGGNNVGIKYALEHGADYIWLLNNDTTVDTEALTELVIQAIKQKSPAFLGSKIYCYNQQNTIWFAGGGINWRNGGTFHVGHGQLDDGSYSEVREVNYVSGCSMFFGKELVEILGLMPEEYFLYFEETDWCTAGWRKGISSVVVPGSVVYHKESSSTGLFSPMYYYYLTRNRLYFLHKYSKSPAMWLKRVYSDIQMTVNVLSKSNSKKKIFKAILKGYRDFLFGKMGRSDSDIL